MVVMQCGRSPLASFAPRYQKAPVVLQGSGSKGIGLGPPYETTKARRQSGKGLGGADGYCTFTAACLGGT